MSSSPSTNWLPRGAYWKENWGPHKCFLSHTSTHKRLPLPFKLTPSTFPSPFFSDAFPPSSAFHNCVALITTNNTKNIIVKPPQLYAQQQQQPWQILHSCLCILNKQQQHTPWTKQSPTTSIGTETTSFTNNNNNFNSKQHLNREKLITGTFPCSLEWTTNSRYRISLCVFWIIHYCLVVVVSHKRWMMFFYLSRKYVFSLHAVLTYIYVFFGEEEQSLWNTLVLLKIEVNLMLEFTCVETLLGLCVIFWLCYSDDSI